VQDPDGDLGIGLAISEDQAFLDRMAAAGCLTPTLDVDTPGGLADVAPGRVLMRRLAALRGDPILYGGSDEEA
jgi:hypothetical protein